ncbi:MAG: M14 family metallopeptidase [Bacteroidetes bacterium]|nr:M14 family metallopeptidase [Bacteroidota bacterium]MDA0879839.1 M14 family metallopeptidase [Bacteroidota bacterium]
MRLLIVGFILLSGQMFGQKDLSANYYLPQDVTYNSKIPTPASVIGHEVGEWHVTHDKLVQYMYAVAAASDRISIVSRGTTFEGRPLLLLTITSTQNHANLESIHKNHLKRTNEDVSPSEIEKSPIVVYQGFSIHGNEPSGSNAALMVAYYLAAAQDPQIDALLNNTVILFDPSFNPDGLQRFAYWANTNRNKNLTTDGNDREYHEVWPGGRSNHYWFDMNRDWLPVQLPESRARLVTFHDWLPNILTDHHEMGTNSSFFFQPGIPERTHPLTPSMNQELTRKIGTYHAAALDQIGSLYYSEEDYDDFYYGKGSTFPDINGSVGILFEQASSRGHVQESDNGILTFAFTIRNQFTAALSTLKAAVEMRKEMLNYQYDFFKARRDQISNAKTNAYLVGDQKDVSKMTHFLDILLRHQIKVHQLDSDITLNGKNFKAGKSYVIPKDQKNKTLLNAMFEKRTSFQDSLFYDISAWSFPLAFNLDFADNGNTKLSGAPIEKAEFNKGTITTKSNYAYLFEWHDYYAPKLAYRLLSKGVHLKVGKSPFSQNDVNFDYGTIMIPAQNQSMSSEELFQIIDEALAGIPVQVFGVGTGLNKGIDLGSGEFSTLKLPKIGLFVGGGVNPHDAGEMWHMLDQRFDIPISKLDVDDLSGMDLSRYNVLIASNMRGSLSEGAEKNLKSWIEDGGTLVAYGSVLTWLAKKEWLNAKFKSTTQVAKNISFDQKSNFQGAQVVGGAIFNSKIDRSHPINFGTLGNELPVFRNSTMFMEADKDSYNNPVQYTDSPLLSGYISTTNLDSLKGTSAVKIQRLGRGRIVGIVNNTAFRAFWFGTNKLLLNSIFFREEF